MLCVKVEIINSRLISEMDKKDILDGLISSEELLIVIKVWVNNKMPNYLIKY